nr:unnamed protein product [Digitaria exilis]
MLSQHPNLWAVLILPHDRVDPSPPPPGLLRGLHRWSDSIDAVNEHLGFLQFTPEDTLAKLGLLQESIVHLACDLRLLHTTARVVARDSYRSHHVVASGVDDSQQGG